ncbi:MAG: glycosyl transferase, group 1 [Bryobacterales bacterium]|nr:glycosyl transferase, group 1 [Bryobacterales bacterium]
MNILFLDQFNQPGGAQQCLLDLLPAVIERGWKPVAMLPGDGPLSPAIQKLGVSVIPVRCAAYSLGHKSLPDLARFAVDLPAASAQIAKACRQHAIDLLYVNGPRLALAAVLASRGRFKVLFHCHNYLSSRYAAPLTGGPLRAANATVVASSHYVAVPLRRWLPAGRVQIVYNGVAEARTCRRRGRREGNPRIGVIGRIAPEKGQDLFLRAARILQSDVASCEFVISGAPLFSGSGYERDVISLAGGMRVEFTGWLEDVEPVLASLDLLVVPSTPVDATPRIVLQAFAAGVPVLAFAGGGFRELIDHGRTGFLLPTRSPDALAAGIRELLFDPDRLDKVAAAARFAWRERFQLADYRRRILRILEGESKP